MFQKNNMVEAVYKKEAFTNVGGKGKKEKKQKTN